MKFDDVFDHVGEMGTYQWLMFFMVCMISVFGVEAISVNFVAAYMDHWCEIQDLGSVPYDQQKYIAIPEEDGVYSNCEYYDINYANYTMDELRNWNRTTMIGANVSTNTCNSWIYDQSEFVSSSMSKYDLVCSQQDFVPLVSTLFMVGIMLGSFVSGPLSDRMGRRSTILIFILIKIVAALMSAFSPNFIMFCVARVLLGVGGFSAYLVAYVLVMELVGPMYRTFLGVGFQMAYSVGMLLLTGMSFSIRDDTWLQLAYILPAAVFSSFWWVLPESPRWLMLRAKYDEANKTIRHIAAVNRRPLQPDFDTAAMEEEDRVPEGNCTDIYKSKILRRQAFVIYLFWFTVNLIYYALSFNIGSLSGSVFVNTAISAAVEIPANILCILLCNWRVTGRRLTCCFSLLLAGVSCFIRIGLIVKGLDEVDTAFSFVGRAFVTVGFSAIYVYAAEVFPTEVRNAGLAFAAIFAQISGIVSPYVGGPLTRVWAPLPALIFGVLSLASGFSVLYLPETLGHTLFETVEELEHFASGLSPNTGYGSFEPPSLDGAEKPKMAETFAGELSEIETKGTGCMNPGFIMTEFSTRL